MSDTYLEAVPADGMPKSTTRPITVSATLTNDPKKPDFRCSFYTDQAPRWCMIDALMGGTESMRSAGETHLPRFDTEAQSNWRRRLESAVLLNYFRKTVVGYTGKPFGKPVEIPEDLDESLQEILEDVDGNGTDFHTFAQTGFEKGVAKGIVHALIDFPDMPADATADDESKTQPTVTLIEAEALIGARQGADGNLDQVRIYECTMEPDGEFGEKKVERVRVIERMAWRVYKRDKLGKRWMVEANGVNSLGEISLVTFRTDPEGFMRSRPPLLDLAYKNIEHWQSSSDQRNVLTVARFPILVGAGVNPQDPMTIGPNNYIGLREPTASLRFVEHGGAAINAGRTDLEDIKAEMAILGLSLLLPQQSGSPTATAKALDGAESVTELQRLVGVYENFLNEIVYWIARWNGMTHEEAYDLPKLHINQDYAKLLNMDAGVQALMTARAGKDISRGALISAMKRRNILPADFDEEDDQELLDEEAAKAPQGLPPAIPGRFGFGKPAFGAPEEKPTAKKKKIKIGRSAEGKVEVSEEE
jgi:hypothetical protein